MAEGQPGAVLDDLHHVMDRCPTLQLGHPWLVMIALDQVLASGDCGEQGLETLCIIAMGEGEVPDDPEVIVRSHSALIGGEHRGIHGCHRGEGAVAEGPDIVMPEMRVCCEVVHARAPFAMARAN